MQQTKKAIPFSSKLDQEHFRYFTKIMNPFVSCTVNLDITYFLSYCHTKKYPFFATLMYLVQETLDQIPEFQRRIEKKKIVEYSYSPISYTLLLPNNKYAYCSLYPQPTFMDYLREATLQKEKALHHPTLEEENLMVNPNSFVFVTDLVWFSFTSLSLPVESKVDSHPRISFGKYFQQENSMLLPASISCHHALVDGYPMGKFYEILQNLLNHFDK
jgi:chloramphenicol O-acetyltransferase type A